ncbi:MAG: HyaD/HybD family hydrogenase maturation endopeptidase [Chloroflexi bacterium]|nr:HyaD/HybD family hydrogenase maturation endopeptidase [Chloroflexota bacterium]
MPTILVLGLGNMILRDEGVGVRAVGRLAERYRLPEDVALLDGGTIGLGLLPYLEGVTHLLIIDTVQHGRSPGAIVRLQNEQIPQALALKLSMHQAGLQELLAALSLQGHLPPHVVLWGIEPLVIEPGLELSEPVAQSLDALVDSVTAELRAWGVDVASLAGAMR